MGYEERRPRAGKSWIFLGLFLLLSLLGNAVAWWMYAQSADQVRQLQGETTRQAQAISHLQEEQEKLRRLIQERPPPTETPTGAKETPTGQDLNRLLDLLAQETSSLRGLALTKGVGREFMSKERLRAYLEAQLAEEYPETKAAADAQVMALLGLLEEGTDLYHLMLELYTEQIVGLYDPKTDRMYLIGETLGPLEKLIFVHEYVHALQDHHFDLGTQIDARKEDDDGTLALEALAEGDATLLMEQYLLAHMDELLSPELLDTVYGLETPKLDAAPWAIQKQLMFPYQAGLNFVWWLYDRGGWTEIDAAWNNPPRSTEQILHPERYPDDHPQVITIPPLTTTLGTGWRLWNQNTLGEFMLRLHLSVYLDEEAVKQAATGWDGDRYALYSKDGDTCLVILLAWDDQDEADEFIAAYQTLAQTRYRAAGEGMVAQGMWWAGRPGLYLEQRGALVWLILTSERTTAEAVAQRLR